jgi:hypothetical protein
LDNLYEGISVGRLQMFCRSAPDNAMRHLFLWPGKFGHERVQAIKGEKAIVIMLIRKLYVRGEARETECGRRLVSTRI